MKQIHFTLNADEVLGLNAHLTELFEMLPENNEEKLVFAGLQEIQKKLHALSFIRKAKNKIILSPVQALALLIAYRKYYVSGAYAENVLRQITTAIDQKIV